MNIRRAVGSDVAAVAKLLDEANLATTGIADDGLLLLVAEDRGRIIGAAAVEQHGTVGLLRSVVVDESVRSQGIGTDLVSAASAAAGDVGDLWLLTEDAGPFFRSLGWSTRRRDELPSALRLSGEYLAHCTASAEVMSRGTR